MKLIVTIAILLSLPYFYYSLKFISSNQSKPLSKLVNLTRPGSVSESLSGSISGASQTEVNHIVFGIAASANLWKHRKDYVKLWWKPNQNMNGVVWFDKYENDQNDDSVLLPPIKISSNTTAFRYNYPNGLRSAIRITRIVSETVRLVNGTELEKNVRWIVMGDDDTVFFTENLVKVLRKYDHNELYYIGSSSESHLQNLRFSYGMGYGGGGFCISYKLAKALEKIQDRCIERYTTLYGSDDRIHACMTELGVPLTKEIGFHQFDVFGKLMGLLSAHPVAPIISMHHLDLVDPIFPNMDRVKAMKRLMVAARLDSPSLVQQSICYDTVHRWTVSVSWGYTIHITRGVLSAKEMEIPMRTFSDWYKNVGEKGYTFNTRPISKNTCQHPRVYFLSNALMVSNKTASEYVKWYDPWNPKCMWNIPDPSLIERVIVYKTPDPNRWSKAPRRDCCRVLPMKKNGTMRIEVGACRDGEIIEFSTN